MNSEEISRDLSGILQLGFVVDIQLSLGASIKPSKAPQMWWGSRHGFQNTALFFKKCILYKLQQVTVADLGGGKGGKGGVQMHPPLAASYVFLRT